MLNYGYARNNYIYNTYLQNHILYQWINST